MTSSLASTEHWKSAASANACAKKLAQAMQAKPALADCLITLEGALGSGKSTFARYLLQALGVVGRIKSPSYAVVESYALPKLSGIEAWHCDFYRFQTPSEWEDRGLREVFSAMGLKLVEWPNLAQGLLPEADLTLQLDFAKQGRSACWQAQSPKGKQLLGKR